MVLAVRHAVAPVAVLDARRIPESEALFKVGYDQQTYLGYRKLTATEFLSHTVGADLLACHAMFQGFPLLGTVHANDRGYTQPSSPPPPSSSPPPPSPTTTTTTKTTIVIFEKHVNVMTLPCVDFALC